MFFVVALFASYVCRPLYTETHISSRIMIGGVLFAWLLQAISMICTLRRLKALPESYSSDVVELELELDVGHTATA